MSEKLFTRGEAIRIAELAIYEATGTKWGCSLIARKVLEHYDDEDGKMKEYVHGGEFPETPLEDIDLS
jgi:hypothetical protein